MIYFLALIPATALSVAGYFALYLSQRSEGGFRSFGKYLGFWAFTLAGLVILGAIFAAAHGERYRAMMRAHAGQDMMHCPWQHESHFFRPGFGEPPGPWAPGEGGGGGRERAPASATPPVSPPAAAPAH